MQSQLEQFLAANSNDPAFLATAMGTALFLGAAHALTPGHGKTIVAAYLAGSRGRIADAFYLGAIVTVTHTASVFALGLATLYASTRVSLDRVFPWLSLLSGALVLGIGAWLLWQRTRSVTGGAGNHGHHHGHSHSHGHAHSHSHGDVTRGNILSLGISGGLVPCPEAMVVLMLSISLRRIALGLSLLVAFSLGLAAVLIAIGVAMVLAGPALRKAAGESPWTNRLPVISAAVVTVLGAVMVAQALRTF
ncbi:MAG: sulfite exporter TauE/SafE family protein [Bryobacteraceae bacterium]